jgi:CheY-like chemotaxis protein
MDKKPKTILYIDDDPDDREILSSAVKEMNCDVNVIEVENGIKALDYLNRVKKSGHLPCLILLDLNMPMLDGKETLVRIRQDNSFEKVPVIVYTSSNNPNDKIFFDKQGVLLITKPPNILFLRKIVERLLNYCVHAN